MSTRNDGYTFALSDEVTRTPVRYTNHISRVQRNGWQDGMSDDERQKALQDLAAQR